MDGRAVIVLAAVIGYLIGSIPSADWIGRLHGIDPRKDGTGNPGAANIIGLAGKRAGLMVLGVDIARGAAAAVIGRSLGGDAAGLVAAVAATMGQKFNPWFRFRGGKGLAISGGTTFVVWPVMIIVGIPLIVAGVRVTGSAARGALVTVAGMIGLGLAWGLGGLENFWGVGATLSVTVYAVALAALLSPKFITDVRAELVAP